MTLPDHYRRFLRTLMALGDKARGETNSAPAHAGAQQWTQAELDAVKARHARRLRSDSDG